MNIFQLLKAIYDAVIANNQYLKEIYDTLNLQIPLSEPNATVGAETKDETVDGGKNKKNEL